MTPAIDEFGIVLVATLAFLLVACPPAAVLVVLGVFPWYGPLVLLRLGRL